MSSRGRPRRRGAAKTHAALVACVALSGLGCASGPRADLRALHYRSMFDLGCPAEGLQLHHVDRRTKVVAGCGRRLVYVESCESHGTKKDCTWMVDSPIFAQSTWPQTMSVPAAAPVAAPAVAAPPIRRPPPVVAASPDDHVEGRPIRTDLDGTEQSVIPSRRDARRPVRTDLFDQDDQVNVLQHRR